MMLYWELIPILFGFIIEYFLYTKYKFRAGGVVIIPLFAIYFVKHPFMIPFLILLTGVNYWILEILYSKFIVYGRRLLYLSLIIGILLTILLGIIMPNELGWYSFVVPGLFAYNIHREVNSTVERMKSLLINSAVVVFLIIISFIALYLV
jgi:hypothetical protein